MREEVRIGMSRGWRLLLLALLCGCSNGTIIVSDPQVFTRERLVQERFEDTQWLESELAKAPTNVAYQGVRDFREFVGIYNELRVGVDPLQGQLNVLENKIGQKRKELELAKADKALQDYLTNSGQQAGDQASIGSAPAGGNSSSSGASQSAILKTDVPSTQNPKLTVPASSSSSQMPKGSDAQLASGASPGILDLFNDRYAYRNAVRAAMRDRQLDDAHDIFGAMLYDFQFDLTIRPGTNVSQFAQVRLTLEEVANCKLSEDAKIKKRRGKQYAQNADPGERYDSLYKGWIAHLQKKYQRRTADLQTNFLMGRLDQKDVDWLIRAIQVDLQHTFEDRYLGLGKPTGAEKPQNQEKSKNQLMFDEFKETFESFPAKDQRNFRTLGLDPKPLSSTSENGAKPKDDNEKLNQKVDDFVARLGSLGTELEKSKSVKDPLVKYLTSEKNFSRLPGILKHPKDLSSLDKAAVLLAIGWAVREEAAAYNEYVKIDNPSFIFSNPFVGDPTTLTPRAEFSLTITPKKPRPGGGLGQDGISAFKEDLCAAGQDKLRASSVEPKEYAQNVSEVAARETLVTLVSSLSATLQLNGTSANNYSEYARKTQEFVQAINRKPLAIGFGEGHSTFGWVFGPKFAVKQPGLFSWLGTGSLVEFSHVPVRHSFRSSVVIPAWWDSVRLTWECGWMNDSGTEPDLTVCGNKISSTTVNLPMPRERWEAISLALLRSSETTRPEPKIRYPSQYSADPSSQNGSDDRQPPILLAFDKDRVEASRQGVLIEGEDLWRNPQVFLGGLPASKVKILSDMRSLYAIFDMTLLDQALRNQDNSPGKDSMPHGIFVDKGVKRLDLTVITSAGADTKRGAVIYDATPPKAATKKPTAVITTAMVIQNTTKLGLAIDESLLPDAKLPLTLRALPVGVKGAQWLRAEKNPESQGKPNVFEVEMNKFFDKAGNESFLEGGKPGEPLQVQLSLIVPNYPGDQIGQELLPNDGRTIVLFKTEAQAQAKLSAANSSIVLSRKDKDTPFSSDKAIKITLPGKSLQDLFYKAYPDLQKAATDKKVEILANPRPGQPGTQLSFQATYNDKATPHEFVVSMDALAQKATEFPGPSSAGVAGKSLYGLVLFFGQSSIDVEGVLTVERQQ